MKVKKLPFLEFKNIYRRVPRLCVEVVLVERGRVLLVRRTITPYKGKWHLPGATVLQGETLSAAVKRTAREELGIAVEVKKFIGVIEYAPFKGHLGLTAGLAFLVRRKDKRRIILDNNASAYDSFSRLPFDLIQAQKKFLQKTFGFKSR